MIVSNVSISLKKDLIVVLKLHSYSLEASMLEKEQPEKVLQTCLRQAMKMESDF